jgi:hypothetical protein
MLLLIAWLTLGKSNLIVSGASSDVVCTITPGESLLC